MGQKLQESASNMWRLGGLFLAVFAALLGSSVAEVYGASTSFMRELVGSSEDDLQTFMEENFEEKPMVIRLASRLSTSSSSRTLVKQYTRATPVL